MRALNAGALWRAAAVVATGVLLLAACGGDDSGNNTSGTAATTAAPAAGGTSTTAAGAVDFDKPSGKVRGFDGTTIRVASIGIKSQLPGVEFGAQARIKRFNDTNEIPGVKIEYVEFVDDKLDPATALSESRRLVTSENVFAMVGDVSANNPGDYFKQQKVPYFGYAFDFTYCSNTPDPDVWGFGFNGCLVPQNPKEMPDTGRQLYDYAKQKTGKEHPTIALFSSDTTSGKNSTGFQAASYSGAGFTVVYKEGVVPPPPVSDYTPYVQKLLTADNGKAPDVMVCLLSADCIPMYTQLVANNYQGIFHHTLYSPLLVQAMKGSTTNIFWANPDSTGNAKLDQVKSDIAAVKADQPLETGSAAGYFSTDMFIQAVKTVAAKGKDYISPENVRKAAANQTWQIEGVAGPTRYPDATVMSTPQCETLLMPDGTKWNTLAPYDCSEKRHPVGS